MKVVVAIGCWRRGHVALTVVPLPWPANKGGDMSQLRSIWLQIDVENLGSGEKGQNGWMTSVYLFLSAQFFFSLNGGS
jgi:hypothetical protein